MNGNFQSWIPESLQVTVMSEVHNILTESAHGGDVKSYSQITSTYYWPRSLAIAYHPQADGQTKVLNQLLEIFQNKLIEKVILLIELN